MFSFAFVNMIQNLLALERRGNFNQMSNYQILKNVSQVSSSLFHAKSLGLIIVYRHQIFRCLATAVCQLRCRIKWQSVGKQDKSVVARKTFIEYDCLLYARTSDWESLGLDPWRQEVHVD
jgi:hypothetical protein